MKARYEQVRARGNDRPLVFPTWDRPTADDRTIVYQKGAYVLHELRELAGRCGVLGGHPPLHHRALRHVGHDRGLSRGDGAGQRKGSSAPSSIDGSTNRMRPCKPFRSPGTRAASRAPTRVDYWWLAPAATAIGLIVFFGYLTFRAFNATYVWFDPYISPTVAPPFFTPLSGYPGAVPVDHAWFGAFPSWWPPFLPQSPAFFAPALAIAFRLTCYYYRGAYYKAAFMRPPNCAVGGAAVRVSRREGAAAVSEPAPLHALRRAVPASSASGGKASRRSSRTAGSASASARSSW